MTTTGKRNCLVRTSRACRVSRRSAQQCIYVGWANRLTYRDHQCNERALDAYEAMNIKKERASYIAARKTIDLVQELLWALQSRPQGEIRDGLKFLQKAIADIDSDRPRPRGRRYLSSLVGSMPIILADTDLFPSNEHIAKFANEALEIPISRWEKRSRYEMIGMLVMETIKLPDAQVRDLSIFLDSLSTGSKRLESIKRQAQDVGFSWNTAIRTLSNRHEP